MGKKTLTVREVARAMNVHDTNVTRWLRDGILKGRMVKHSWQVDAVDFQSWLGNPDSVHARKIAQEDNREISLVRLPAVPQPLNPPPADTPDVEFLLGELRRKVS